MRNVYLDVTQIKGSIGVYVRDAEVIWAGARINAMPVSLRDGEYARFAKEYDIHFIFEDSLPAVDFYTIPMVDIFAVDSSGGYLGSVGMMADLQGDAPICYIDAAKNCYLAAANGPEFLAKLPEWKSSWTPCTGITFFESLEAAQEKYEFIDTAEWNQWMEHAKEDLLNEIRQREKLLND